MKALDIITLVILIIGGINWGLIGLFDFNLVGAIFGGDRSMLTRAVYIIVGLCAIYQAFAFKAMVRRWSYDEIRHAGY